MSADEDREDEDHAGFDAWFLRGIADGYLNAFPRHLAASVPGRDPVAASPWLPIGPANIGGRVRCFAVDPVLVGGRPRALYAGAASGGLFRSLDDGRSWESIWPASMPCPAIGAIAIGVAPAAAADAGTRYLWVATGEKGKIPGDGVWRLKLGPGSDAIVARDRAGTLEAMEFPTGAPVDAEKLPRYLENAAVDPDDPRVAWFVGPRGAYRCTETAAGFDWARFHVNDGTDRSGRKGPGCADVAFLSTSHGRYVVLACLDSAFGDLILLDAPAAAQAAVQTAIDTAILSAAGIGPRLAVPLLTGAVPPVAAAMPRNRCKNARLAIVPDAAADRVYVIYSTERDQEPKEPMRAICVGAIARAGAPPALGWVAASGWATPHALGVLPSVFESPRVQGQGGYNLAIAATARAGHPDVVAVGMVDVFVSADAATTFVKSLDWTRYDDVGDVGQHADQHALVLASDPGPAPALWVANDGGVAVTADYLTGPATPAPPQSSRWRRRIAGMVISQTYDLSQSAALPDVCGVALQDLGAWSSGGSPTWRHVQGGDGLGIAFDPHDPHHLVTSWQGEDDTLRGCYDVLFGGSLDFNRDNLGLRRALFRGVVPHRILARGMAPADAGTFEDLVAHPTHPGHLLHIRRRRLYTTRDGEVWELPLVGDRLEIFVQLTVETLGAPLPPPATLGGLMVTLDGAAALGIGFMPGETSDVRDLDGATVATSPAPKTYRVRIVSGRFDPEVGAGDHLRVTLELSLGGGPAPSRFRQVIDILFPAALQGVTPIVEHMRTRLAGAVAAGWSAVGGGAAPLPAGVAVEAHALPAFVSYTTAVEIVTDHLGPGEELVIGGSAAHRTNKLRIQPRTYVGGRGRPAVVMLQETGYAAPSDPAPTGANRVGVGDTLDIAPRRTIPPPAAARGAPIPHAWTDGNTFFSSARPMAMELEQRSAALAPRPACRFWPITVSKWVRLRVGRTPGPATPFALSGSALPGLVASPPAAAATHRFFDFKPARRGRFDLRVAAPPSRLTVTIGAITRDIDFDPAALGGLSDVTVEEVRAVIDEQLNHHAVHAATDIAVEVQRDVEVLHPMEVAYSPVNPDVIWMGALNHVFVSTDGGRHWRDLLPPPTAGSGNYRNFLYVEAIAPDPFPPSDPANPVYTALVGVRGNGPDQVFRCSTGAAPIPRDVMRRSADYEQAGDPLRVYALEADPRRRGTYYAGTELGVYRSTDHGDSFASFSEGLPHVPSLDLAVDQATDTLRVALFGRGIYQRALGAGAPTLPALYLRANERDGARRPVPHGAELGGDTPTWVDAVSSPDLKLTTRELADLEAMDATEIDEVPHEPARRGTGYRLLVRANSRAPVAVDDGRIVVAWAEATTSLPELPASFWTAVGAGPVAAAARHGAWTVLADGRLPTVAAGTSRHLVFPCSWPIAAGTSELDGRERIALIALVIRGTTAIEAGPSDVGRLVVHDARVALRLTDVRAPDEQRVALRIVAPATGPLVGLTLVSINTLPAPAPATAPVFPAIAPPPAPAPLVIQTTTTGPFDLRGVSLELRYAETHVTMPPTHALGVAPPGPAFAPAPARAPAVGTFSTTIVFDEAPFRTRHAVPAAELRAYLARRLATVNRLIRVEGSEVMLALRSSPTDIGPRIGGAAWSSGELVVTAAGTAATDASFAWLALLVPATLAIGAPRRFSVRVWNRGDVDVAAATVRFFWLDPHSVTPVAQQLGADQPVAVAVAAPAIASVEAAIPALSHDDVLVIAEVDHPADPAPPRNFTGWDDVLRWARTGTNTVGRMFRRAP